jgi:thiol:disulfide interchange protein DsbD
MAAFLLLREVRSSGALGLGLRALGVLAGLWAIALFTGAALGGHDPLRPIPQLGGAAHVAEFKRIKSLAELDAAVAAAAAAGKPAMLDFYADWCVSCKEMERDTFPDARVRAALANAVLLQADVTANNADDQALLRRFGIFGPPTIAFYGPDGVERARYRVVGFMPAPEFADVVTRATAR